MKYIYSSIWFKTLSDPEALAAAREAGLDTKSRSVRLALLTVDGGRTFVSPLSVEDSLYAGASTLVRHDSIYEARKFNRKLLFCPYAGADVSGDGEAKLSDFSAQTLVRALNAFGAGGWRLREAGSLLLMEKAVD